MRKIQDYILKDNKIYVGLEDSKRTWKLCIRSDGMIVHETSMPADYDNLKRYLGGCYPGCRIQVIYEAGFSGFWLHDLLMRDEIDCVVTPANRVTVAKVNKIKTDKRDARRLAKNLENGDYVRCHVPDAERREDRQLSRTLEQIQRDIIRAKNRIRRFLDFHGLNGDMKHGNWYSSDYRKLRELPLQGSLKVCLDSYLHILDELEETKAAFQKELSLLCKKERYAQSVNAKKSIPGIGLLTAIRLTLEWGEMSRFPSGKHIASFTGLTSREYSTGDSIRRGRITGHGSESVRSWLIQSSWRALRLDPALLEKFQKVWKNSGSKKKAIVAIARKMAVRMRAIELSQYHYCTSVVE